MLPFLGKGGNFENKSKKANYGQENAQQNETAKVQVQSDMQSFAESTTATLNSLQNSCLSNMKELTTVKRDILTLKSELDKLINKFIVLELQLVKQAKLNSHQNLQKLAQNKNPPPSAEEKIDKIDRSLNIIIHAPEGCNANYKNREEEGIADFFSNCLDLNFNFKKVIALALGNSMLVTLGSIEEK